MSRAMLYDATICVNCKQCETACAEKNGLPYDEKIAAESVTSDHKYLVILNQDEKYMRKNCMHCNDPACASVCPVGALQKTQLGPVVYEASRCIGCRYCMLACPFDVPKYEWNKALPLVRKCTGCPDLAEKGAPSACATVCPTGATKVGDRDELIAEARKRIQDNPGQYENHIYGMEEVGGTSVLLLSSVPFDHFGFNTTHEPLPMLTYRVLSKLPDLVIVGGVMLGGIWWITSRRNEVAMAEGRATTADRKEE